MGFDASVISGVVKFIEPQFELTKLQLGWAVSSLTLTATLAMLVSGPLSDKYGRRVMLKWAAVLYAISAIASALAPDFVTLVAARMIGGLGVGASLILAPMYIAEIAPTEMRGRMVSFNQLNIVIGISVAFFTNYMILKLGQLDSSWALSMKFGEYNWRWMLGLETLPAILYFLGLYFVPRSPRWLIMKDRVDEARPILLKVGSEADADSLINDVKQSLAREEKKTSVPIKELFQPTMKLVLTIGIVIAVLQQITGINSVFFYAPMIFEQSGIGTDASFAQAILVGLTNLIFTVVAILFIDRFGRKPLLIFGLIGITFSMSLLAYGFGSATFRLDESRLGDLKEQLAPQQISALMGQQFDDDVSFKKALREQLGDEASTYESALITASINMNPTLILIGIVLFVASFAFSLGPVMWVLFSELFPLHVRGLAISFVGLINSGVSFLVQLVFPWELENLGSSTTFLIYGLFAAAGLIFVWKVVPETKGKSLEELEKQLVK